MCVFQTTWCRASETWTAEVVYIPVGLLGVLAAVISVSHVGEYLPPTGWSWVSDPSREQEETREMIEHVFSAADTSVYTPGPFSEDGDLLSDRGGGHGRPQKDGKRQRKRRRGQTSRPQTDDLIYTDSSSTPPTQSLDIMDYVTDYDQKLDTAAQDAFLDAYQRQ